MNRVTHALANQKYLKSFNLDLYEGYYDNESLKTFLDDLQKINSLQELILSGEGFVIHNKVLKLVKEILLQNKIKTLDLNRYCFTNNMQSMEIFLDALKINSEL